jgi:uncharacterized surface protein with fasciclin (FAS1) repeats
MYANLRKGIVVASVVAAGLFTAGCGSDSNSSSSTSDDNSQTQMSDSPSTDTAADLVGPGCADYAKAVPSGKGSVSGMAEDPVAVAASNNPLLKTLVAAVSGKVNPKVDLVDTLDGGQFTVFAPVDTAFAKIPKSVIATLARPRNAKTLQSILTYHVLPGQLSPNKVGGTHTTAQGEKLTVKGSGDDITVQGAKVICGGVHTANATVYLIDTVMMPPSMMHK